MRRRRELWMAVQSFGQDAVAHVIGDTRDLHAPLSDDELAAIARQSTVPYWTDGTVLWSIDYRLPNSRPISAADALARFGLEALEEAREKGTWQP